MCPTRVSVCASERQPAAPSLQQLTGAAQHTGENRTACRGLQLVRPRRQDEVIGNQQVTHERGTIATIRQSGEVGGGVDASTLSIDAKTETRAPGTSVASATATILETGVDPMPADGEVNAAQAHVAPISVVEHHGIVHLEPRSIVNTLTKGPATDRRYVDVAGVVPLLAVTPARISVRHRGSQARRGTWISLIRIQRSGRQSAFMETCQTIEHEFTAIDGQRTRAERSIVLERQATRIEHNATTMTIRSR